MKVVEWTTVFDMDSPKRNNEKLNNKEAHGNCYWQGPEKLQGSGLWSYIGDCKNEAKKARHEQK